MTEEKATKKTKAENRAATTSLAAPVRMIWDPIKHFILADSSSGVILLLSTIVALIWANFSPDTYTGLWDAHASIKVGSRILDLSLRNWINDGLMTIFFLLVGLEIKRELIVGELSSFSQAILPVVAAAGGMLFPALIFTCFAHGTAVSNGWGIPVATDIAFALGVLTLVGRRVPASLKAFLAALAIADDLGAILVIALFYPGEHGINVAALGAAGLVFAALLLSNKMGIRTMVWYTLGGLILWLCVFYSGIHSSIAGVLLAITIPSWTRSDLPRFRKSIQNVNDFLNRREQPEQGVLGDPRLLQVIETTSNATDRILPTSSKVEHALSSWVAMIIMPLFALANSGVNISSVGWEFLSDVLTHGIAAGLIFGKPIGIVLGTYLVIKLGFAKLPRLATWKHMWGVGMLGGIGFTMALFVAGLAIGECPHLDTARLSILCSSTVAGTLGFTLLKLLPPVNSVISKEAVKKSSTKAKSAEKTPQAEQA